MLSKLPQSLTRVRNRHFLAFDLVIFTLSPLLALKIRLDEAFVLTPYGVSLPLVTILFLIVKISILWLFGFYRCYWLYAGVTELERISVLAFASVVVQTLLFRILHFAGSPINNLPQSLPILDGLVSFLLIGGVRLSVLTVERISQHYSKLYRRDRALIVGAGSAGTYLAQKLQKSPWLGYQPVAFIDDDINKLGLRIQGLVVVGNRAQIAKIARSLNIQRVIIAMPSVSGKAIREIVDICQSIGISTSTLPGLSEIINGRVSADSVRDVQIEDLLRRAPIRTEVQKVSQLLAGKRVLITGAGGSIGSELCRQVLKCNPAEVLLLGHGENSVFNIQQELERVLQVQKKAQAEAPIPRLSCFIADIRFQRRLKYAFEKFQPEIIFHAAAHKHVPMMELNSPEAITNNVQGTKNLLNMALRYNVQHFVMISTDKAVNPTNIMGASKRVAEMLVLQAARHSGKPFVVVRFGNVLGSRGSVIPTFKQQITQGGPVTITHPDICRYFMTIPEAVQLVLQAAVLGRGGEVFMLDMGQPVRIIDLAKDLIRLSGYELGKDIDITYTGLRPGEKLFEELFIPGEKYERTEHEKIIKVGNASRIVSEIVDFQIEALCQAAKQNDTQLILTLLMQLVPEYTPGYEALNLQATTRNQSLHTVGFHPKVKLHLEKHLQLALANQEFRVFYQPIISLDTNKLMGFEALLRWQHPTYGLVSPAEFIPIAEATDLIIPLGWWVLSETCQQMQVWQQEFSIAPNLTISVNLTSKQFFHPDLVTQLEQILNQTQLNAVSLRLEVPESAIVQNAELATAICMKIRSLGVQLQIDNCGIADSSLSYLGHLPSLKHKAFTGLKLDRSLTNLIEGSETTLEIIQRMIAISQELGIQIIATGVETAKQINRLKSLKCGYGQGYFFSKPIAVEGAMNLIKAAHTT